MWENHELKLFRETEINAFDVIIQYYIFLLTVAEVDKLY